MSRGKKRLFILIFLLVTGFVIMTWQYKTGARGSATIKGLSYPYNLISDIIASTTIKFRDHWNAFEENKRLKKELSGLFFERQMYEEIINENKRLKEILKLKEYLPTYVTTAKVIGRGSDRLLHTLIMDKGENHGIKKDMAVITQKGLVGKVYSVRDEYSEFLLISDPNFSVAVRLQNSRIEGILSGTGNRYCLLKYIPPDEVIEKNEVLITSGLDGIIPPGLPVGVVSKVEKNMSDFFQHIEVMPLQRDSGIEEVVILKSSM